ncbi:MAG: hypothetical protein C4547_08710 [Phycisphaerales bacterium]|nr:MAG: hypothetical protein C4547_08710 [Phycisphaerales bacterium]
MSAIRRIECSELAGTTGYLFAFVVRRRITREGGDECLFDFYPVFVRRGGGVDEAAARVAVERQATEAGSNLTPPNELEFFEIARTHVEKSANLWDWEDDVEFVGLSFVEFF